MVSDSDPDWYFENVLYYAQPGGGRVVVGPAARWQKWWRDRAVPLAGTSRIVAGSAELVRAGIPRHEARRRMRRGEWSSPQRGTVALLNPADGGGARHEIARRAHTVDAAAAALANPGTSLGGRSAAIVHGLPTMAVPHRATLLVDRTGRTHRGSEAALDPSEVTTWFDIPVLTVARTVVDLARRDRRDGVLAADAALRERLVTRDELERALRAAQGWPGVRQARQIVAFADPLAESPLESVLRLAIHDAGLPAPELQVKVRVPGRREPYRVDMCWPDRRLIVEADGRVKYRDRDDGDARWAEKKREVALQRLGFRVERVLWADVVATWPTTRSLLADALAG